ncbi:hypothetical protein [Pelagicoccus sp. SDUM812003]|uniref:hypothetical protein n=1 Tax=Pelagicoccus sp. SDUM812003 TaxID=3041267 RepID=UPI00280C8FC3|nr:hypothetical protein [Pelagicoccus sp. SDUM812003]MDQ8205743.1 hypothetical protein [Pelagicoccus sp. SDUM812003]
MNKRPQVASTTLSLAKYLPLFVAVAYVVGFVAVNSHLESINVNDPNLISIQYLFAGTQMLLLLIPVLAIIWQCHPNPTDEFEKSLIGHISGAYLTSIYAGFVSIILTSENKFLIYCFIPIAGAQFVVTSYYARNWSKTILISFLTVPLAIFFLALVVTQSWIQLGLCFGLLFFYIQISTNYGEWGDGNLDIVRVSFLIASAILAASHYGSSIYGDIPGKFGGGRSREAFLVVDPAFNSKISGLPESELFSFSEAATILHESSDFYFIRAKEDTVLAIRKVYFAAEVYKKKKPNQAAHTTPASAPR